MKRSYMVMQDVNYQLFAESVEAECTFGIKQPNTELAEKTLEELGLISLRERHPNTLSGGQKQRLAAATSMVCGKSCWYLTNRRVVWIMTVWCGFRH